MPIHLQPPVRNFVLLKITSVNVVQCNFTNAYKTNTPSKMKNAPIGVGHSLVLLCSLKIVFIPDFCNLGKDCPYPRPTVQFGSKWCRNFMPNSLSAWDPHGTATWRHPIGAVLCGFLFIFQFVIRKLSYDLVVLVVRLIACALLQKKHGLSLCHAMIRFWNDKYKT